jgi:glycosyltransferase involved in cell wall biosynthesis
MEHKGQHFLIAAFETLLQKNPGLSGRVRLRLRGFENDREYYRRIQDQVAFSPQAECIEIVPFCSSDGVEAIYREAHLVVLLSRYEGFGLPVLEAQGMGIPVLCSDLPVLREVGGEGAVYVVPGDAEGVAGAMLPLIQDEPFYKKIQEAAVANGKRFSWEAAARQTLQVYRSVL